MTPIKALYDLYVWNLTKPTPRSYAGCALTELYHPPPEDVCMELQCPYNDKGGECRSYESGDVLHAIIVGRMQKFTHEEKEEWRKLADPDYQVVALREQVEKLKNENDSLKRVLKEVFSE